MAEEYQVAIVTVVSVLFGYYLGWRDRGDQIVRKALWYKFVRIRGSYYRVRLASAQELAGEEDNGPRQ